MARRWHFELISTFGFIIIRSSLFHRIFEAFEVEQKIVKTVKKHKNHSSYDYRSQSLCHFNCERCEFIRAMSIYFVIDEPEQNEDIPYNPKELWNSGL